MSSWDFGQTLGQVTERLLKWYNQREIGHIESGDSPSISALRPRKSTLEEME
jgi:hypothetical protein